MDKRKVLAELDRMLLAWTPCEKAASDNCYICAARAPIIRSLEKLRRKVRRTSTRAKK